MTREVLPLAVAIPTYRREAVLLATLRDLLALQPAAAEIIVVDQTEAHEDATAAQLGLWHSQGRIRWIRRATPSVTAAMNEALLQSRQDIVLFVDDDVRPEPQLLAAHLGAHAIHPNCLIAGRVIQPWQEDALDFNDAAAGFASLRAGGASEFIGCNFSLPRRQALAIGGFDENFVRVAYRYEAEFAHRWRRAGHALWFEPQACLHHLKEAHGGTRTYGEHLTTWRPDHAVGAYYCAIRTGTPGAFVSRPWASVATRYHVRHPWRIPSTLWAEATGMVWACRLAWRGARYVGPEQAIS